MSSDITIHVAHSDGYSSSFEVGNMTSNVNSMLVVACGASLGWFDKVPCAKARPILAHAWQEMKRNPDKYRALEDKKGWGTYDQFMPYLTRFYAMTRLHPTGVISNWF